MRVLLVGQAPNRSGSDPRLALLGACGQKIAAMAGITLEALSGMDRVNVETRWTPSFRPRMARIREIWRSFEQYDRIVVVGIGTARALRLCAVPKALQKIETPEKNRFLLVLPHPSGRNRWYNAARNRQRAQNELRRFLRMR